MQPLTAKDQIYQKVLGKFWVQRHGAFDPTLGWRSSGYCHVSISIDDGTWADYVPRGLELLWTGLERIWNFIFVVLRFLEDAGDTCSSGDIPNWAALNSADAVEMRCFVDVRVSLLLVHPIFCLMHSSFCAGFHLQRFQKLIPGKY